MNNILIVVAHPDDEVLGCGGTIAKYSKDNNIYNLILGTGVSSRNISDKQKKEELIKLKKDSRKANKLLGVQELFLGDMPDNKFDSVSLLDIIAIVESKVKKIKPRIIYTHHSGDLNIDHRLTFQAVLTAARPVEGCSVKEIYSFEVPSSTEWSFSKRGNCFTPAIFEDITKTIEIKLKAMEVYKSEMRRYPHPRSPQGLEIISQRWGLVVGKKYVEPFELIRKISD